MIQIRSSCVRVLQRRLLGPLAIVALTLALALLVTHSAAEVPLSAALVVCVAVALASVAAGAPRSRLTERVAARVARLAWPRPLDRRTPAVVFVPLRL